MRYKFGDVLFTPQVAPELTVDGQKIDLPKKQSELLEFFLLSKGTVQKHDQILLSVWGPGDYTYETLRSAISRLNNFLPPDSKIINMKRQGYLLNVDVTISKPHITLFENTQGRLLFIPMSISAIVIIIISFIKWTGL